MKTKIIFSILFLMFNSFVKSQVIIATNTAPIELDDSAVLKIVDSKRGVLFPQVSLLNVTDQITVPTPVVGLTLYNTATNKYNFWEQGQWNRTFTIEDGLAIIKQTENFSGKSNNSTTIIGFPTAFPLFNLDDTTANWTNLQASTTIIVTKSSNTNYVITEGMVQINNTTASQVFEFAIGVFVDGQLKLASKYSATGQGFNCCWKKFNLSGVFDDLSIGTHTVEIYGRNLPKITSGYSQITYGGNTSNCSNINNDMARIFVTAQVTQ